MHCGCVCARGLSPGIAPGVKTLLRCLSFRPRFWERKYGALATHRITQAAPGFPPQTARYAGAGVIPMRGGPKPKRYRRPSRNSNSAKDTAAGQRQYLRIDIGPEENLLIELIRFRDDPPPPPNPDAVGGWFN